MFSGALEYPLTLRMRTLKILKPQEALSVTSQFLVMKGFMYLLQVLSQILLLRNLNAQSSDSTFLHLLKPVCRFKIMPNQVLLQHNLFLASLSCVNIFHPLHHRKAKKSVSWLAVQKLPTLIALWNSSWTRPRFMALESKVRWVHKVLLKRHNLSSTSCCDRADLDTHYKCVLQLCDYSRTV